MRVRALLLGSLLAAATVLPAQAATTSVSGTGALNLTVTGPDAVTIGVPFTVSLVVTNTTPNPTLSFASVDLFLPPGNQLQGAIVGGVCARLGGGTGDLRCQLPSLDPGASATVSFNVLPQTLGLQNIEIMAIDAVFLTPVTLPVQVNPAPTDVQVTGSASTGSPVRGQLYSYTFQVKDNGPWPAPSVTFSDALPAQVNYVGVSSSACSQAAGVVSCAFGDMAVGAQQSVVITVQAPSTAATYTDSASVDMAVADRQPSNNSVGVTVQVK